ncbi:MAG: hypothetical protein Q9220_003295 [cf. Caloplaca sp. 1 TL-2023]
MPGVIAEGGSQKKRKRNENEKEAAGRKNKTRRVEKEAPQTAKVEEDILILESQISQSRKHYNNIATLLRYCQDDGFQSNSSSLAAVAMCRIFCRLMANGSLSKPGEGQEKDMVVFKWLRGQLESYKQILLDSISSKDASKQSTALTLLMRLLKTEAQNLAAESVWRNGVFAHLVSRIVRSDTADAVREEYVEKYMQSYDDVRLHTFACLSDMCIDLCPETVLGRVLSLLAMVDPEVANKESVDSVFVDNENRKQKTISVTTIRKQAQELWLRILRNDLSKAHRKIVLSMMTHQIAPWFTRLELLMDFLTDSFNAGGSMSLAALAGLFHLMQEKNLDYPQFYTKLYSLLNPETLHSKHRSQFFRLLDTFLSSTHLPVALVASFIKGLARLTLTGPPSGIVVVVPWIYNLLKTHLACTFMIHRKAEHLGVSITNGLDDPFDMEESDPMETNAVESSLWEIHTLQSHYHANVAAISRIISEQFTKQAYNLEDFLDHSYLSMLDAELSKEIKKEPVIEYEIPKKIFLKHPDSAQKDGLLVQLWGFS